MPYLISILLLILAFPAVAAPEERRVPVDIIFDTDMDSDCDDLAALAILHALADRKEARILATGVSTKNPSSAMCLEAINTFYGRAELPVGAPRGKGPEKGSKYARQIAGAFPHRLKSAEDAPEAVRLYRDILSKAPDQSVTIVTVGYLNNIANLLKLPAEGGQASGMDLIKAKVKEWVCMGGNFVGEPARDDLKLGNNNFTFDKESSLYAVENWPVRLVFVGREIGSVPSGLKAGAKLKTLREPHPIRMGYELYFGGEAKDRHVADPTTVLYAVRGPGEFWRMSPPGKMNLHADMTFEWQADPAGRQLYVMKPAKGTKSTDRQVEAAIDELLLVPKKE